MTALVPTGSTALAHAIPDVFVARRNFFNFFGITCRLMTTDEVPFLHVHLKAFKLREQIGVFADEARTQQVLAIQARSILDFGATYDITDTRTGEAVGALRRKGLKSLIRDEWEVLDPGGNVYARVREDSWLMALLRRFLSNLIPQHYHLHWGAEGEQPFGEIRGNWNPFIVKHTFDLGGDPQRRFDRRVAVAASVLLMTVESKQEG